MGDRATLKITFPQYGSMYLYTHWGGSQMPLRLQEALTFGRPRWGDDSYLTRIVVSRIIGDQWNSETGHGLTLFPTDSEYPNLELDLDAETVSINGHTTPSRSTSKQTCATSARTGMITGNGTTNRATT